MAEPEKKGEGGGRMAATHREVHPVTGRATASTSLEAGGCEHGLIPEVEWKPGKKEYAVMLTLALISLMVALDATILVSVLPVSLVFALRNEESALIV